MHTLRSSKSRRVSCNCDLYFVRLKDSSSLYPVEKALIDEHTDYFIRLNQNDYQLSQLNVINQEHVTKETFENLLYCVQKRCFPVENFNQNNSCLIKALFEVFNVSENLSIQSVCILIEKYLQTLLDVQTCIPIWRGSHNGSLYLSNISTQAFAYIVSHLTHQIHFNRSDILDLTAIELLTILRSPYLCLLDASETFHLTGHYFLMSMLTVLEIWAQDKPTANLRKLQTYLNLPSSVKALIRSYQEDHDPLIEHYFVKKYKFSRTALHYPKDFLQTPDLNTIICPSSRVDPKSWALKSIRIYLDIKEQYIVGCSQVLKHIWQNMEETISFGNTDTRNTAAGGFLEIGPGEAITAVQIYRSYRPNNSDGWRDNYQLSRANSLRKRDSNPKLRPMNSAFILWNQNDTFIDTSQVYLAVVTRCAFIVNTYACSSSYSCSKLGIRRKIFMPPMDKAINLELEELSINVDVDEVRKNGLATASHLFGLAEVQPDSEFYSGVGISMLVPVWAAADNNEMQALGQTIKGMGNRMNESMGISEELRVGEQFQACETSTIRRSQSLRVNRLPLSARPQKVDIEFDQGRNSEVHKLKRSYSWKEKRCDTQNTKDFIQRPIICKQNRIDTARTNNPRRVVFSKNHYLNETQNLNDDMLFKNTKYHCNQCKMDKFM